MAVFRAGVEPVHRDRDLSGIVSRARCIAARIDGPSSEPLMVTAPVPGVCAWAAPKATRIDVESTASTRTRNCIQNPQKPAGLETGWEPTRRVTAETSPEWLNASVRTCDWSEKSFVAES